MSLASVLEAVEAFTVTEQTMMRDVQNSLFDNSYIWKERDEKSRRLYLFFKNHQEAIVDFFEYFGWVVAHDEGNQIASIKHLNGLHRWTPSQDVAFWAALIRLIYQEAIENCSLSKHPMTTVGELINRYLGYFPGNFKKKTSFNAAMVSLTSYGLIRPINGLSLKATSAEQVIEILPPIQVYMTYTSINDAAKDLQARKAASAKTAEDGGDEEADGDDEERSVTAPSVQEVDISVLGKESSKIN